MNLAGFSLSLIYTQNLANDSYTRYMNYFANKFNTRQVSHTPYIDEPWSNFEGLPRSLIKRTIQLLVKIG